MRSVGGAFATIALAWKIAQSPRVRRLTAAKLEASSGNLAGTAAALSRASEQERAWGRMLHLLSIYLWMKAGTSARMDGRALYAAVRTLPLPTEPLARLWHGANLLRAHRARGAVGQWD